MKQSGLVFRHYMRRALFDPIGFLILIVLPVILIVILGMVLAETMDVSNTMVNGYNMISSELTVVMFVMFQFFGGSYMLDWLYFDFKSAKRWRLLSAPCSLNTFIMSAGLASWIFSMVQGVLILTIGAVFLDAYFGNVFVLAAVLLVSSAMGLFLHTLLFLLTKTKSAAEGLSQVIIQGMMFLSVWMANFGIEDNPVMNFFFEKGTPIALAKRAIEHSGFIGNDMGVALQSLGILLVITVLLGGSVLLLGRRRSF